MLKHPIFIIYPTRNSVQDDQVPDSPFRYFMSNILHQKKSAVYPLGSSYMKVIKPQLDVKLGITERWMDRAVR